MIPGDLIAVFQRKHSYHYLKSSRIALSYAAIYIKSLIVFLIFFLVMQYTFHAMNAVQHQN